MAIIYLEPQDVTPAHARQVLDFLNRAETPEEIAAAVEIAAERDVGLRVAQRLLDRRRQLGGFTDLAQVAAVPQVGPERFTEIVLTLSDARLPQVTPESGDLPGELRALRALVERLQAAVGTPRRVTLRALQAQPFLGQPVNLVATVMEGNRPVISAPVTLIAGWGRLRAAVADAPREGPAVILRTGADGSARALLLPPTSEALLPVQQDALVAALNHLDPAAATPRAAVSGLQALARLYRHEGNVALRRAVDIYFRDFGRQEALNAADPLAVWGRLETAVTADAPEPGGSAIQAGAVLALRIRDWLGAWLATYRRLIESEGRLAERLKQVQARGEKADVR